MFSLILHGRRLVDLQKWCSFRVSVNILQNETAFSNSFSSATAAADVSHRDCQKGKNFTVSYLVDSLGLSNKVAESISRKVSFDDKGNPDSVLNLFRSHGFTDSQISTIVTDYPGLLILDAEKSLGPRLQVLQSRGASSSELAEIVSTVPRILGKKRDETLSRYYDVVKEMIKSGKSSEFEKLSRSCLPQGSVRENKIRNLSVLRELGLSQRLMFSLLVADHGPVYGKERFEESLNKVLDMGFDPTTSKFLLALRVVYGLSDKTTEEKLNAYEKLGLAAGDVWAMFKKWPSFLNYSEKKISQTFITLNKCGLHEDEVLSVLKKYPQCIGASEKRIENSIETFLGLGFSRDEVAAMVKCFPPCLNLSVDKLKKKTEFLVKKMNWATKGFGYEPSGTWIQLGEEDCAELCEEAR